MSSFDVEIKKLNAAQRQAVETIDGPLLIIAGPGTGKTQLLSARVAQILRKTDTLPQNILCLTFTESGAQNMRERLTRFIGQAAHDVTISTYHAFGGDLIARYPEHFAETRMQNPIDELGRHQLLANIVDRMSYANPLKQTRYHLGDLIATISEVKRALLTSDVLREIAAENSRFITEGSRLASEIFSGLSKMPGKLDASLPYFEQMLQGIMSVEQAAPHGNFLPLAHVAQQTLETALEAAQASGKSSPLTAWKNRWLAKDSYNNFVFAGELENKRISALADVLDEYQRALETRGFYDFDDMIIQSIQSLEQNPELKYTLQEQYLYILLDEFQDTNAAQLRLVQLLSDNPVHEGRPNVMAVGDDDQAIYAFQGAQYSNMLDFYRMYQDVAVINLTENYRSHADILHSAHNVAKQISERLHHKFEGMEKTLTAANPKLAGSATITRNEFLSDIAQYDWVAGRIESLIASGVEPNEIAVLAPKHRQLEPLVPYLNSRNIPVRYEKRENILEAPVVRQLLAMSKLVLAIRDDNRKLADSLWVEVLSYEFWKLPTAKIWQLSWKVSDAKDENYSWSNALLEDAAFREPALLLLALASKADSEPLEAMLDFLIGTNEVPTNEADLPCVRSPLRSYYTSSDMQRDNPQLFYETLSHLKVLRERLRDYQKTSERSLMLPDLLEFVQMYEAAQQQMINTSPYNQDANAVQIMTVFKAKGLEFEHVFLPCCTDDVWGGGSRGNANKLTLPPNLAPIRHAGATDDERLRILFVALTRAKIGLHLASFTHNYNGKTTKRLKYLDEQEQADGTFRSMVLPPAAQPILTDNHTAPELEHLELDWRIRHADSAMVASLRSLLEDRLLTYKLSPTHLNSFTDTIYGGPIAFYFNTILRFPQAPSFDSQYGSAMHDIMEWIQHQTDRNGKIPATAQAVKEFARIMRQKKLPELQTQLETERGKRALTAYLRQRASIFKPGDKAEHNFYGENVRLGDVRLSGKIDRLEIDEKNKTITIVDYKTGKPFDRWRQDAKLHKYKQQLYCYKTLVEHSRSFQNYTVAGARLEFLEPDSNGDIQQLELQFKSEEESRTKQLLAAVWQRVMNLEFPDISNHPPTLAGILAFEDALLKD